VAHGICLHLNKVGAMWHLTYVAPRYKHMPRGLCLQPMCHVSYIGAMWRKSSGCHMA
jgi:hypothetical protein